MVKLGLSCLIHWILLHLFFDLLIFGVFNAGSSRIWQWLQKQVRESGKELHTEAIYFVVHPRLGLVHYGAKRSIITEPDMLD